MTRYQDPTNQSGAVTTTWHPDSLGQVTTLEKPGVAPQTRIFDSWGNVTQVQWCDDMGAAALPKARIALSRPYDAFGRVTHREDKAGGQTVPETVSDFSYDANSGAVEGFPRNNMLGRLASATWSTGQEWFTYDDLGRVNSRTFVDTTVTPNPPHHYEIHEFHHDGSEKTLHLAIQDTNKEDEQVNYDYNSAGRIKSVVYNYSAAPRKPCSRPPAKARSTMCSAASLNAQIRACGIQRDLCADGRRLLLGGR